MNKYRSDDQLMGKKGINPHNLTIDKDTFHSSEHYERFMLAVKLAMKINEYLDKGYLVFTTDFKHPVVGFVLDEHTLPPNGVKLVLKTEPPLVKGLGKEQENGVLYYGWSIDGEKNIVVDTKKEIKQVFKLFNIINPKDIIKGV